MNAIGLTYHSFTMAYQNNYVLIVGQVTSFEDVNAKLTDAVAPSGFIFGLDTVNSCVIHDGLFAVVESSYTSVSCTLTDLDSGNCDIST